MLEPAPYHGFATFLKSPIQDQSKAMGIVGIPFDSSTSYRPGQRFAPNAIRQASMMLTDGGHPIFETIPGEHVSDYGDIVTGSDTDASLKAIEAYYEAWDVIRWGKPAFALGGDHAVSLGILRGIHAAHDRGFGGRDWFDDIKLVIFDSHCDCWETNFGLRIGHGTWVRNAVEEGLVKAENVLQLGLRSPVDPVTRDWLKNRGAPAMISVRRINMMFENDVALEINRFVGTSPWYMSIDIDAIDPSMAPGTGTPEIAGITTHAMLHVLQRLNYDRLIGADVVEVLPMMDPSGITSMTAATLLWTIMAKILVS